MKELPRVFANKIDNINDNNRDYSVSKKDDIVLESVDVNKKINEMFSSYRYVYKIDVIITTEEGEFSKKIIGKKNNNLITIDNELINIDSIKDIKFEN